MDETHEQYLQKYDEGEYHLPNNEMMVVSNYRVIFLKHDNPHRDNGPSIIYHDGTEFWHSNGKRHRLDGPAVTWKTGLKEWWISGREITKKIKPWATEQGIDLDNLTNDDKVLIKLVWEDYRD